MEDSKISFVVPVYNAEKYLRRCLDSILIQTYSNIEVIIVDDGSTDDSGNICNEYKKQDARVSVIHTVNQGVSAARNTALEHVTGEYILFVDSDDWIEKDMCKEMISYALAHNAKMVTSLAINRNEAGDILDAEKNLSWKSRVVNVVDDFSFLDDCVYGVVWGTLYKRECIREERFDSDIYLGEDTLFYARAVKNSSEIVFLAQRFYNYVNYQNSTAHGKITDKKMTNLTAWDRICELYKDNPRIASTAKGAYGRQCAYFLHRMCMIGQKSKLYYNVFKKGMRDNWKYMMMDPSRKNRNYYRCIYFAPIIYCKMKGQR